MLSKKTKYGIKALTFGAPEDQTPSPLLILQKRKYFG
jgi:hypothetical protein